MREDHCSFHHWDHLCTRLVSEDPPTHSSLGVRAAFTAAPQMLTGGKATTPPRPFLGERDVSSGPSNTSAALLGVWPLTSVVPRSVLVPFYGDPIASLSDAFVGPRPGWRGLEPVNWSATCRSIMRPLGLEGWGPTHPDRMKLEKYCMTFSAVRFSSGVNCPL